MSQIRFISLEEPDGWLAVRLDAGDRILGTKISLPYCLKVELVETRNGRDYFQILEGPYRGRRASAPRKSQSQSWLVSGLTQRPAAGVQFSVADQSITYNGKGPFSAFSGAWSNGVREFTPIPAGHYEINMPDSPHDKTRSGYYRYTKYHKTWFRIGNFADRYLHVGVISEGCVTVRPFLYDPVADSTTTGPFPPDFSDLRHVFSAHIEGALGLHSQNGQHVYPKTMPNTLASWDDLYLYLICSRLNDHAVGTLIVK